MPEMSQAKARGGGGKAVAAVAVLPDRVLTTVEGWWERYQLRRELEGLRRHGELERTLADSGIAPSDIPRLLRAHPHTRQQLAQMMQRLGIDRAALPRTTPLVEALREMEWQCGACADWRHCRAWLASPASPEDDHGFCPNAGTLNLLRGGEPVGRTEERQP